MFFTCHFFLTATPLYMHICQELRDRTSSQACPIITHREESTVKTENKKIVSQINIANEVSIWSYVFSQS